MEYIKEIHITEAVIHILDNNSEDAILNEYSLDLNEEIYSFLLKHIEKALKDEELKYAIFNKERNIVKEMAQQYLSGENNLIETSKELARQLFMIMRSKGNVPSCDLIVVSISTEYGPLLGILKMDYIKNYTHSVELVENRIGIEIIPQYIGLPGSGQRLQKCVFIKPMTEEQTFNLMIIDKQTTKGKEAEEYGANYFVGNYLGCTVIDNERDHTKNFVKAAENWTRKHLKENADTAEVVRTTIKNKLKEEESIDVKALSEDMFKDQVDIQQDFVQFVSAQGVNEKVDIDKEWVQKKLKRVRLNIDKDIDLYINGDAYHDKTRFEIQRNGDGSINMIIKHVMNYMEK